MVRTLLVAWNSFNPPLAEGHGARLGECESEKGRGRIFLPSLKLVPAPCLGRLNFSIFQVPWGIFFFQVCCTWLSETPPAVRNLLREICVLCKVGHRGPWHGNCGQECLPGLWEGVACSFWAPQSRRWGKQTGREDQEAERIKSLGCGRWWAVNSGLSVPKGFIHSTLEVNECTKKPQKCLGMQREWEVWAGGSKAPLSSWYAAHGWGLTLFKHNLLSLSEWNQGIVLHLSS